MICKGLEKGKFSPEDAMQKLEEFVDLDLISEDHQEIVESLIAEAQDEEYYWTAAKKDARRDYDEEEYYDPDDYYEDEEELPEEDEEPLEED